MNWTTIGKLSNLMIRLNCQIQSIPNNKSNKASAVWIGTSSELPFKIVNNYPPMAPVNQKNGSNISLVHRVCVSIVARVLIILRSNPAQTPPHPAHHPSSTYTRVIFPLFYFFLSSPRFRSEFFLCCWLASTSRPLLWASAAEVRGRDGLPRARAAGHLGSPLAAWDGASMEVPRRADPRHTVHAFTQLNPWQPGSRINLGGSGAEPRPGTPAVCSMARHRFPSKILPRPCPPRA